jgi:hypothetical protein
VQWLRAGWSTQLGQEMRRHGVFRCVFLGHEREAGAQSPGDGSAERCASHLPISVASPAPRHSSFGLRASFTLRPHIHRDSAVTTRCRNSTVAFSAVHTITTDPTMLSLGWTCAIAGRRCPPRTFPLEEYDPQCIAVHTGSCTGWTLR